MALADAINVVADAMEATHGYGADWKDRDVISLLKSFASQLRIALKASEGQQTANPFTAAMMGDTGIAYNRQRIEEAKAAVRREREAEDEVTERMLEVRGGPSAECVFPVSSDVPNGAFLAIAGERYQLTADEEGSFLEWKPLTKAELAC